MNGKALQYTIKERSNLRPYHKLQRWQDGKNHTGMFPRTNCRGPDGPGWYAQFRQLTAQYADLVIEEPARTSPAQKKSIPPKSSWSRRRNPATDLPV